MRKVFIIILKFNGDKEISRCLSSIQLIKLPTNWQKEILIVDNNQKIQNSKLQTQNYNLNLKIILNKKNLGFARGMNVGIRYALKNKADAVLLLNQDTVVKNEFLLNLLENSADIVAPIIKFRRGSRWFYDYGGKVNWWLGKTGHIEKSQISNFKSQICEEKITSGQGKIDYVSGCCMLIRRPAFAKIGFFDERYFLYFEDVDFCLRAKKAGFKIAVEPKSVVIHFLKEGKRKPLWQRWQMIKSNLVFINRWICWWRRLIAWGYWLVRGIKIILS